MCMLKFENGSNGLNEKLGMLDFLLQKLFEDSNNFYEVFGVILSDKLEYFSSKFGTCNVEYQTWIL